MNEYMVIRIGNSFFVEPFARHDRGTRIATGDYASCMRIAEQRARQRAKQRSRSGCEYEAVRCGDAYSLRRKCVTNQGGTPRSRPNRKDWTV